MVQGRIDYVYVAKRHKATYFAMPDAQWKELSQALTSDEMWEINKSFLEIQLKAGKQFIFSHNPEKATGAFLREVKWLRSKGLTHYVREGDVWRAIL